VFANQDFVWGVGLMISGAMVAFAVVRYGVTRFRTEVVEGGPNDWNVGRGWDMLISTAVPLQAVILLGWWLYQSAAIYAPDTWYNPLEPFSVMTVLLQWAVVLVLFIALNRWLVQQTLYRPLQKT